MDLLPFMTDHLQSFNAEIRVQNEDFRVEEIPMYCPCGDGTHVYFLMEKWGLTTLEAIGRIASALDVKRRDIGYAGQKDTHGVTRQWISIEHIDPDRLLKRDLGRIKIIEHGLHKNKLRVGHLLGNRFVLKLRQLSCSPADAEAKSRDIFDVLCQRGAPNYYGPQRFGNQQNSHWMGKMILLGDVNGFYDVFLGQSNQAIDPSTVEARAYFESGDYQKAFDSWPTAFKDERRLLRELIYQKDDKRKAYRFVNKTMKRFYISAFQSYVFNLVLASRMPQIDTLLNGDIAYKHDNGACFLVEDVSSEQDRCANSAISPTGPIFGAHMKQPESDAAAIEQPIVNSQARDIVEQPNAMKRENIKGARRPLRMFPQNTHVSSGTDEVGDFVELKFDLPAGSYATVLLREFLKRDVT